MEIFILLKVDWEYNSTTGSYYRGDGVTIIKAFSTRESAEEECLRKNIEAYQKLYRKKLGSPAAYVNDNPPNPNEEKRLIELGCKIDGSFRYWDWNILIDAVAEQDMLEVMNIMELVFFEIQSLECAE